MATAILHNSTSPIPACTSQLYALGKVAYCLARENDEFEPVTVIRPSSKQYFSVKEYLVDRKTKETYWPEETEIVMTKCALLFFVAPVFAIGKIVYALLNTIVCAVKCALQALSFLAKNNLQKGSEKMKECTRILGKGLWEIVKAPLFCAAYQATALYGLHNPLRARKYLARIEQIWNYDTPFLPGIKECKQIDRTWEETADAGQCSSTTKALSALIVQKAPVYIAPCLQPRGCLGKEMKEIRSPFLASCLSYLFPSE